MLVRGRVIPWRASRASWWRRSGGAPAVALTAGLFLIASGASAGTSLDEVLEQLAARNGFLIEGLARTAGRPAADAEGDLRNQLETLLIEYNHVLVDGTDGRIVRVVIGSHRAASVLPDIPAPRLRADPVEEARLTSPYGPRWHPVLGTPDHHDGIDLAAPVGTPIRTSADGIVVSTGWRGAYGRYVRIRHDATYETAYAHLSDFAPGIFTGARVARGQIIGFVGASGRATGSHLHYEILRDGIPVNPLGISLDVTAAPLAQVETVQDLQVGMVSARADRMIEMILTYGLGAGDDGDLQQSLTH